MMKRAMIAGAGLSMMAGLAAAAAMGGESIAVSREIIKKNSRTGRQFETPRKARRQADRSNKQYLIKGVRP